MQFAARLVAFSAAISQALALVALTNSNWDVTEGTPFEITWTDADGAVTLLLKDGPSSNLATVATIASKFSSPKFQCIMKCVLCPPINGRVIDNVLY